MAANLPTIFGVLSQRAGFLQARHAVLAQNVANADTPRYQPQDLVEPDFANLLKSKPVGVASVAMERTRADHLAGSPAAGKAPRSERQGGYEVAPAGNAVIVEEQMRLMGGAERGYQLATSLYGKYVALMRAALGNGA